jgi:hypothetical protein
MFLANLTGNKQRHFEIPKTARYYSGNSIIFNAYRTPKPPRLGSNSGLGELGLRTERSRNEVLRRAKQGLHGYFT